nr:MAG TPA: hypothetical protein [Caudoviricetes sp.]
MENPVSMFYQMMEQDITTIENAKAITFDRSRVR